MSTIVENRKDKKKRKRVEVEDANGIEVTCSGENIEELTYKEKKAKKKHKRQKSEDTSVINDDSEITNNGISAEESYFEAKKKKKAKKQRKLENGTCEVHNSTSKINDEEIFKATTEEHERNHRRKDKKSKKKHDKAENVTSNEDSEIKRKKKEPKIKNESQTVGDTTNSNHIEENIECELMLNAAALPVKTKEEKKAAQKVQTNQKNRKDRFKNGNSADPHENCVPYIETPVGMPHVSSTENKKVDEGVQLGFQKVNFKKPPAWTRREGIDSRKSYQHLIVGDIIVGFKNCNLHEVKGYGVK